MIRTSIVIFVLVCGTLAANSGWNSAPSTQYHIQTDEGPERYFRYQTQSGQYRKEKRLQDGTVIGSYGWVDADGYLRLRDYIADNEGYRILKSKTVFVGPERPIEDAIKSTKKVPPQAGILVRPSARPAPRPAPPSTPAPTIYSYLPPSSTPAPTVYAYLPPSSTPAPTVYDYLPPSSTPAPSYSYVPVSPPRVLISHNSIESSTEKPRFDFRPTVAPIAASSYTERPVSSTTPVYVQSTEAPSSTYAPPVVPSTYRPRYYPSSTPAPVVAITPNIIQDFRKKYFQLHSTTSERNYYDSSSDYESQRTSYVTNALNLDPYSLQNTPVDRDDRNTQKYQNRRVPESYDRRNPATLTGNQLGNGYDPQYPLYDGISVTNDGFRYYLPRQYHEEENSGGDTRAGSFGYVDPFGIRRVVYYNTSPGSGFVHRKNNRYVGFDATPYDPRPV